MTTRITTFAALFAALLGCTTVAQSRLAGGQDPMALLQLQQVVRAALDEVGRPSSPSRPSAACARPAPPRAPAT